MFEGALLGQSAAEFDADEVLSDTCHNRERSLPFFHEVVDWLCILIVLLLSPSVAHSARSSFCVEPRDKSEADGSDGPLSRLRAALHCRRSPPPVALHREPGRDVEEGWGSDNSIPVLRIAAHVKPLETRDDDRRLGLIIIVPVFVLFTALFGLMKNWTLLFKNILQRALCPSFIL